MAASRKGKRRNFTSVVIPWMESHSRAETSRMRYMIQKKGSGSRLAHSMPPALCPRCPGSHPSHALP